MALQSVQLPCGLTGCKATILGGKLDIQDAYWTRRRLRLCTSLPTLHVPSRPHKMRCLLSLPGAPFAGQKHLQRCCTFEIAARLPISMPWRTTGAVGVKHQLLKRFMSCIFGISM